MSMFFAGNIGLDAVGLSWSSIFKNAARDTAQRGWRSAKESASSGNLAAIYTDIKGLEGTTLSQLAHKAEPNAFKSWVDTRILGTASRDADGAFSFTKSNNRLARFAGHIGRNPKKYLATGGALLAAGPADSLAGYLYGGPGYGGFVGFGEGRHSEQNALMGARTNTNYQAQMLGVRALSSNQVAPQYSLTIAPMHQRRASTALRQSTGGLTLGLHKGRHGGY